MCLTGNRFGGFARDLRRIKHIAGRPIFRAAKSGVLALATHLAFESAFELARRPEKRVV